MLRLLLTLLTPCENIPLMAIPGYQCEVGGLAFNFNSFNYSSDLQVDYSHLAFDVVNNVVTMRLVSNTPELRQCNDCVVSSTLHTSLVYKVQSLTDALTRINWNTNAPYTESSQFGGAFSFYSLEHSVLFNNTFFSGKSSEVSQTIYGVKSASSYSANDIFYASIHAPIWVFTDLYSTLSMDDYSARGTYNTDFATNFYIDASKNTVTPEPSTWLLLLTGGVVIAFVQLRRRNVRQQTEAT